MNLSMIYKQLSFDFGNCISAFRGQVRSHVEFSLKLVLKQFFISEFLKLILIYTYSS